jgi:thermitase
MGIDVTSQSDARMEQWQQRRSDRLAALPWLHTDVTAGHPVRYVKGEMLVLADQEAAARAVLAGQGIAADQITTTATALGYVRLTAPGADVAGAVTALRTRAGATAAGPVHVFVSTEGIDYGGPYGPPAEVDAFTLPSGPSAHATTRVTVVDTGVWRNSPLPSEWYEVQAVDVAHADEKHADTGHANFITGVIMSNTDNARVRIVKVLDADGVCREHELVEALLALDDVDVVNLSLGGFSHDDQPPVMLQAALSALLDGQDRAVVAAAGNEGVDRPYWPAAFAGTPSSFAAQVVAVAAHDGTNLCTWSNTGPWVDVSAPGSDITSTYVTHADFPSGFARWSGTSFAAPFVVAAIAESHATSGSIGTAVKDVIKQAATQEFGGVPGLV